MGKVGKWETPTNPSENQAEGLSHPLSHDREDAGKPPRGAFEDALELAVVHLPAMPIPTTFVLDVPGIRAEVLWTSSRSRHAAARSPEAVSFTPMELLALAGAYERDRGLPGDLAEFAARKLREPAFRVDARVASHGSAGLASPRGIVWFGGAESVPSHAMAYGVTIGRLLVHFGARLVRVELEGLSEAEAA